MLFRDEYTLRDMNLAEGENLEFSEEAPPTSLVIHRPSKEENQTLKDNECLAMLRTEEMVTEKVRPQFDVANPPRPVVIEIGDRIFHKLSDYLNRAVGVLRWRRGTSGHPNAVVSTQGLQWSDDGQSWKHVPGAIRMRIKIISRVPQLTDDIRTSVVELVHAGDWESVGHEIFQEAWSLRENFSRSSLLIGMTAAEVGVKSFISDLVPGAKWLALHAPTPPLIQMLTEYLPLLPVRKRIGDATPFVPKRIIDTLKKGVKLRNETAHAGEYVYDDRLTEILQAVRDLLYLLDFYSGYSWALERISHETMELVRAEVKAQQAEEK